MKRMKYWYESCVGTVYSSDEFKSQDELECGKCGDSDVYIGVFETEKEAIKFLNDWNEEGSE